MTVLLIIVLLSIKSFLCLHSNLTLESSNSISLIAPLIRTHIYVKWYFKIWEIKEKLYIYIYFLFSIAVNLCHFHDRGAKPSRLIARIFRIWQWPALAQITAPWRIIMREACKTRRSAQRRILLSFWQLTRFSWFNAPDTMSPCSPMRSLNRNSRYPADSFLRNERA